MPWWLSSRRRSPNRVPLDTRAAPGNDLATPILFVRFKANGRVKAFDNQLPDLLITVAASLKAGHSFRQAIQNIDRFGRERGTPAADLPADRFVICIQNHDQVGNRAQGDRLSTTVSIEAAKVAAALMFAAPALPLLQPARERPLPSRPDHGYRNLSRRGYRMTRAHR